MSDYNPLISQENNSSSNQNSKASNSSFVWKIISAVLLGVIIVLLLEGFGITNWTDRFRSSSNQQSRNQQWVWSCSGYSSKEIKEYVENGKIKSSIYSFRPLSATEKQSGDIFIREPGDVYRFLEKEHRLPTKQYEEFHVLFLSKTGKLLNKKHTLNASGDSTSVKPNWKKLSPDLKDIESRFERVENVIMVHNHPNGVAYPSLEDTQSYLGDDRSDSRFTSAFKFLESEGKKSDSVVISKSAGLEQLFSFELHKMLTEANINKVNKKKRNGL